MYSICEPKGNDEAGSLGRRGAVGLYVDESRLLRAIPVPKKM
jgi:hypothetical protein